MEMPRCRTFFLGYVVFAVSRRLPEIEKIQNRYRENPNVVILALDSGTGGYTGNSQGVSE